MSSTAWSRPVCLPRKSDFDKTLEQIVVNLAVPSNLNFSTPVRCRILLTTTLEATTVGNTILLSKGLIDTLPDEESIASASLWSWPTSRSATTSTPAMPSTTACSFPTKPLSSASA